MTPGRKRMKPEDVRRAADRAAMRSGGRDLQEAPAVAGAGRSGAATQRQPPSPRGWPISLSFLGLVGALLGTAAAMIAFPAYARWLVFPLVLAGWLVSLCLHEFGHAVVAYHSGDRSVRAKGYLTLDLRRYTHWQYSIVLPLLFLAMGGIGLPGGAVYVNTRALRSQLHRALVAAGGPAATLAALGILLAILGAAGERLLVTTPALHAALAFLAFLQLTALVINLLPIPGLDGWGILDPWLPRAVRERGRRAAPIGPLILVVLLFLPAVNRAFWSGLFAISDIAGLERWAIALGQLLFAFWR